jgi:hypothetical protein
MASTASFFDEDNRKFTMKAATDFIIGGKR